MSALEIIYQSADKLVEIMFFDLNMPRMNGIELLEKVRQDPRFDLVPIVIYSTYSRPEDINECLRLGANRYLSKASSFTQLCDDLTEVFRSLIAGFEPGNDRRP